MENGPILTLPNDILKLIFQYILFETIDKHKLEYSADCWLRGWWRDIKLDKICINIRCVCSRFAKLMSDIVIFKRDRDRSIVRKICWYDLFRLRFRIPEHPHRHNIIHCSCSVDVSTLIDFK